MFSNWRQIKITSSEEKVYPCIWILAHLGDYVLFFFSIFTSIDHWRWAVAHRRLSVGRTRASGKRDAQASRAVGLLRRYLIPYSRHGVRDTTRRVHTHTRTSGTIAQTRVYTRLYTSNERYTGASFHSVPFRHSIRAARLASKLSPVLGSLATARHAVLVSCLLSYAMRVHACSYTRECACVDHRRHPPIGRDRLHSRLGMPFPFGNHLGSRTGYDRDIAHAWPRIIRNYRKLIPDWEGLGKDRGGAPKDNAGELCEGIIWDGILRKVFRSSANGTTLDHDQNCSKLFNSVFYKWKIKLRSLIDTTLNIQNSFKSFKSFKKKVSNLLKSYYRKY